MLRYTPPPAFRRGCRLGVDSVFFPGSPAARLGVRRLVVGGVCGVHGCSVLGREGSLPASASINISPLALFAESAHKPPSLLLAKAFQRVEMEGASSFVKSPPISVEQKPYIMYNVILFVRQKCHTIRTPGTIIASGP